MSTKNLARTVIEGGRTRENSWRRRYSNTEHRAMEREVVARLARETDLDAVLPPKRRKVYRNFSDKLGAPRRWLERQVGRPWGLVRSELFQLFDTRTTAGRHIVFCHMLPWVADGGPYSDWADFNIDKHGILRRTVRTRYRYTHGREPLPRPERELERWLDDRRVGERGGALFWFIPTPAGAYRQHLRLAEDEGTLWRSLPGWFRERHHPSAPPPLPRTRI